MRAVALRDFGAPEMLDVTEVPAVEPGAGQVRIAAEAISVGFAQTQMRRDEFPAPIWRPELPLVLGGDVVGVVDRLGAGVTDVRLGDRVGAYVLHGAYADYVRADAATLVSVPADLDAAEATVLPGTGMIAAGVLDVGGIRAGDTVLVHAAAGGVGHLAVQLAGLAGAGQVIATAGSAAKRTFAAGLGADVVIDYTRPDWADQVRAATGGRGVDLILDSVGGDILRAGIGLLAPMGRLVFYGSAGGGRDVPRVSVMELIGLRFVTGFGLSAWRSARPDQFQDRLTDLTEHLRTGRVVARVHARLPLSGAGEGHRMVESRAHHGRVVLMPGYPDRT
jgi:NADPH2:quinone reductase